MTPARGATIFSALTYVRAGRRFFSEKNKPGGGCEKNLKKIFSGLKRGGRGGRRVAAPAGGRA